jgi:hypothetical protein
VPKKDKQLKYLHTEDAVSANDDHNLFCRSSDSVGPDSADNLNINVDEHEAFTPVRCISRPDILASGKSQPKKTPVVCSIHLNSNDSNREK